MRITILVMVLCFSLTSLVSSKEIHAIKDFPIGIRQHGMGNAGVALADDESALFYNPAGLGLKNPTFQGGSGIYQWDRYIYSVESQFSALAYQFPQLHNVGIGAYYRQYPESSMTEMIVTSNGMITTGKTYRFNQYSFAFGTGITLYSTEHFAHCIGTGLMVYTENEIDSYFRSSHSKFDINVGYLVCFAKRLQFGLQMVFNDYLKSGFKNDNSAYGSEPGFIAISTGLGYKDVFRSGDNDLLRVAAEISYSNYGPPLKFGAEAQLFNSCAFRIGEQGDIFSIGTGIALFNHFECNFYWPSNNEDTYYPKSLGFSIRFCRILAWSKDDWQWWKHKE